MKLTRRQLRKLISESMEVNPLMQDLLASTNLEDVLNGLELASNSEMIPEPKRIVYKPETTSYDDGIEMRNLNEKIVIVFKSNEDGKLFKSWIANYMKGAPELTYDDVGKPYYDVVSYMALTKFVIKLANYDNIYRAIWRYRGGVGA